MYVLLSWVVIYGYWVVLGGVIVISFYSFCLLFLIFYGKECFCDVYDDYGYGYDDYYVVYVDYYVVVDVYVVDVYYDDYGYGYGLYELYEVLWVVMLLLILLVIFLIVIGFFSIGLMLYGIGWLGDYVEYVILG